jgi:tetratricopeptide (TPR) repeat protein
VGILELETKPRDAERMLGELLGQAQDPVESASLLQMRANLFARWCRWNDAIADMEKGLFFSPTNHSFYYQLSGLLIQTGDLDGYRKNCQRELAQFRGTADLGTAHQMAKDSLILPDSGVDLALAFACADTAIALGTNDWAWPSHFHFTKGLAEYRQGRFDRAAAWIEKMSFGEGQGTDCFLVEANAVLAMARFRMNQDAEARAALAKATNLSAETIPKLDRSDGNIGADWLDWIFAKALLAEAKGVVQGADGERAGTGKPASGTPPESGNR